MSDLGIYGNGNDLVVARSPLDAIRVWNDFTTEDWVADLYGEVDDWSNVVAENISILQEDKPDKEHLPENASYSRAKNGLWIITAGPADWIEHNGRGWLASWDF
jgi:hypothetical protein